MAVVGISNRNQQKQTEAVNCGLTPKERLIRKPEVLARTGLSSSSLYQKISDSKFPAPLHPYGPRVSVWREKDVDTFIENILENAGMEVNA